MRTRVTERLNEGASGPVFYPAAEITAALNEAQRFFCLLTLGLETTAVWNVTAGQLSAHMLSVFSDWIAPLRITDGNGAKVRFSTLAALASLDSGWMASPGSPQRYVALGADLIALYPQSTVNGWLNVTYARAPHVLAAGTDVPEIPEEYHPCLVDYAIYRLRQVEGLTEFKKSLTYFASFVEGAKHYSNYVLKVRAKGGYDQPMFELQRFDLTKLLGGQ